MDDSSGTVGASLRGGAVAVGAKIVGFAETATVVVSKLDDDEVTFSNNICDGLEASLVGVGACGTASLCIVDNFEIEGVLQVFSPSYILLDGVCKKAKGPFLTLSNSISGTSRGHGGISGQVYLGGA